MILNSRRHLLSHISSNIFICIFPQFPLFHLRGGVFFIGTYIGIRQIYFTCHTIEVGIVRYLFMIEKLRDYEARGLIYSQCHPTLPLHIWNYTDKVQYEGLWDDVTMMCRGLVTDNKGKIVARPFKKFFNLSEGRTNITGKYEIYEKMDGSLGILFFYEGEWILASRGSFTSEQAIEGKKILDGIVGYHDVLDIRCTYCLEIIYKENRIVLDYGDRRGLVLLAKINTATGEDCAYDREETVFDFAYRYDWDDIPLDRLHEMIPDDEEGYVIKFSNGERCKIKGEEYLRLHKIMYGMSTTVIWDALRKGKSVIEEVEGLPDEFYDDVREYENYLKAEYQKKFKEINDEFYSLIDRKEVASKAMLSENSKMLLTRLSQVSESFKDLIWKSIKPEYRRI